MNIIRTSKKYALDKIDFARSFLIAIVAPVLFEIQKSLDTGAFTVNWKQLAMIGLGAGIAYLIKNFFSPSVEIKKVDEDIK